MLLLALCHKWGNEVLGKWLTQANEVKVGRDFSQPDFWANIPELRHFWKLLSALLEKQSTQCGILNSLGILGALSLACDCGIGGAVDPALAMSRRLSRMWDGPPLPVFVMSIHGRIQLTRGKQGTARGHGLVLESSLIQPRERHERAKVWSQRKMCPEHRRGPWE